MIGGRASVGPSGTIWLVGGRLWRQARVRGREDWQRCRTGTRSVNVLSWLVWVVDRLAYGEFSLIRVENQVSGSLSFKTKRRRAMQNSLSATSNDSVNQIASRHTTEYPTSDRFIQSVLTKTGKRQYVPMASNDQHGPNPALGTLRRTHPLMTPEAECQVELSGA